MRRLFAPVAAMILTCAGLLQEAHAQDTSPAVRFRTGQGVPSIYRINPGAVSLSGKPYQLPNRSRANIIAVKLFIERRDLDIQEDSHQWAFDIKSLQSRNRTSLDLTINAVPGKWCDKDELRSLQRLHGLKAREINEAVPGRPFDAVDEAELLNLALKASALAYTCDETRTPDAPAYAAQAVQLAQRTYALLRKDGYAFVETRLRAWRFHGLDQDG